MNWSEGPLLALDFETTGIDPFEARAITAAVCRIEGLEATTIVSVMDAGVEIPDEAAAIHGWTTERLRRDEWESPEVVIPIIRDFLTTAMDAEIPIVVFNARYDLTLLNAELVRIGEPALDYLRVIDPFVIDKELDRYRRGKRTLTALCSHYKVNLDGAHDAGADAIAAARLAWRMGSSIPELGNMDPEDLHEAQIAWAHQQAVSFKAYLVTTFGEHRPIAGSWPVQLGPDEDVELVDPKTRSIYELPAGWDSPYS